jgi:hypothetical protein
LTAEVIPIRGGEVVRVLEQWLEQARRGELVAVAFAAIVDNRTCEGWFGRVDEHVVRLYGALNIARDQYFHSMIEHYDESSRSRTP